MRKLTRKGQKLYFYLSKMNEGKLFTERNLGIAFDLLHMTDEEFEKVVNG